MEILPHPDGPAPPNGPPGWGNPRGEAIRDGASFCRSGWRAGSGSSFSWTCAATPCSP